MQSEAYPNASPLPSLPPAPPPPLILYKNADEIVECAAAQVSGDTRYVHEKIARWLINIAFARIIWGGGGGEGGDFAVSLSYRISIRG